MLVVKQRRRRGSWLSWTVTLLSVATLASGVYLLSLVTAPAVAPFLVTKSVDVNTLPAPDKHNNRIVIPKIGVDIPYTPGEISLDKGAQWRYPERGNPVKGGNFILAAHRFSIQPTPRRTIEKSPFYNIDKLVIGDKIVIDYLGIRYGYEIDKIFEATPEQIEIEGSSDTPKLTLYTRALDESEAGRIVVTAKPLGQVALADDH